MKIRPIIAPLSVVLVILSLAARHHGNSSYPNYTSRDGDYDVWLQTQILQGRFNSYSEAKQFELTNKPASYIIP